MLDFSIIIPVYNAEKVLDRCLSSVQAQTFINYEVILVDDGSSDSSLNICEKYQTEDQRYRVVHQANSGPSAARNVGLDLATGKWICFIDSDDSVEANYLQEIFEVVQGNEVEVVFLGHNKVYDNGNREHFIPNEICNDKIETLIDLSKKDMFGYTWIKCFRNDAIKNNRFDTTLNLFEDEVFACHVLSECEKIGIVNKTIYNYYVSDGSTLMGRTHEDYCMKCDKVYSAWKEMIGLTNEMRSVMEEKANAFVSRSYYYGFERDVNIKRYFIHMKNATFFSDHTNVNAMDAYVRREKFFRLYLEKIKYRAKITLAKCVRRNR